MSGAQSSGVTWLQTPAQFDRLIALSASLGLVGQVELYRACRAGAINLISVGVTRRCRGNCYAGRNARYV